MYWRLERMGLGENIANRREELELTKADLQRAVGLKSTGYLSDIESGKKIPSTELLIKIAKALNTTVSSLTGEKVFIGSNLKLLRKDMSYEEYARYLEEKGGVYVDPELLERYENGKELPIPKVVEYFSDAEGVSTDWFYEANTDLTLTLAKKKSWFGHIPPEIKEWLMDPENIDKIKFLYEYETKTKNKKEP